MKVVVPSLPYCAQYFTLDFGEIPSRRRTFWSDHQWLVTSNDSLLKPGKLVCSRQVQLVKCLYALHDTDPCLGPRLPTVRSSAGMQILKR